ncbi:MAG: 5-(carboxyamino)imidazole ribonucleotide synthase [Rhodothermales bacterium]
MQRSGTTFPRLGIMGGGQLGRMMALAAIPMGISVRFLSPTPAGPMRGLGEHVIGDWKSGEVLRDFAAGCDAITVESEWAPAEYLIDRLPECPPIWPHPDTLRLIRDKGIQKKALRDAGLPVPPFVCCQTIEAAKTAAADFGFPVLLKRFLGSYDGYGNATVHSAEEIEEAWPRLSDENGLMVEAWVPFTRELSVLIARRPLGAHVVYPVAYTEQKDHRCHAVVVPASVSEATAKQAKEIGLKAVETVNGVGITAVELFELADGSILVNELAPRPHNTGHYSIEGCYVSQFENHVRAVLDLPLGNPALREEAAVMINVLGHRDGTPSTTGYLQALEVPGAAVHLYDKIDVRTKRKMGHVTTTGMDAQEARARAEKAASYIQL